MAYEWRNWLDLAAEHLTNAQVALKNDGYCVTAMLGQQAAEQALKGLWIVVADGFRRARTTLWSWRPGWRRPPPSSMPQHGCTHTSSPAFAQWRLTATQ